MRKVQGMLLVCLITIRKKKINKLCFQKPLNISLSWSTVEKHCGTIQCMCFIKYIPSDYFYPKQLGNLPTAKYIPHIIKLMTIKNISRCLLQIYYMVFVKEVNGDIS